MSLRLVQIQYKDARRVAVVDEPRLRLLDGYAGVYEIAMRSVEESISLTALIDRDKKSETLSYDEAYSGTSEWKLLAPIDHPIPSECLVSGTGLTHLGSAQSRNAMHAGGAAPVTDSMRMFQSGVDGGKPKPGETGTAPEWFYKGTGSIIRNPGDALDIPSYADDGGEEAEVAGVYIIAPDGSPWRIGFTQGNEFSDHVFEKKNYLNLAGSKIRTCSIGPELIVGAEFQRVLGRVSIERAGKTIWTKPIATGEAEMCHSLANIEHHHFKFASHRIPGDAHIHFFGAHTLSFSDGVQLQDGDVIAVSFEGFGRPLRNPVRIDAHAEMPVVVTGMS